MSSVSRTGAGELTAVCLVGFMGAGKTSVGRELARRLGWEFVDLDARIEARAGKTVAQIFAGDGEATFRRLESEELQRAIKEQAEIGAMVIAVGGGAFVDPQNRAILRDAAVPSVFLEVGLEEARKRCAKESEQRPLMKDEAALQLLFEERRPFYATADLKVVTEGRTVAQVAEEVITKLGLTPGQAI